MGELPQVEGEDRIAFGLSASRLSYLLIGVVAAYVVYLRPWPWTVRALLIAVLVAVTAALVLVRFHGQPLEQWIIAIAEYYLSRHGEEPAPSSSTGNTGEVRQQPATLPAAAAAASKIVDLKFIHPRLAEPRSPYAEPPSEQETGSPIPVVLPGTQRIIFYSTKGGVGRTTLATEVACVLARHGVYRRSAFEAPQPLRVGLIDCDLASANVSVRLGLAQPTLVDFLAQPSDALAGARDFVLTHPGSGLRVVLGPPKTIAAHGPIGVKEIRRVVARVEQEGLHFLILDVGSELSEVTTHLMAGATAIYYVMAPTAGAIQDTYRGVEALRRLGLGKDLRYVVNKVRSRWDFSEPMADLQGTVCAEIPFDPRFDEAENRHQPLSLQGHSAARNALFELAAHLYPGIGTKPSRRPRHWPWTPLRRLVQRHAG